MGMMMVVVMTMMVMMVMMMVMMVIKWEEPENQKFLELVKMSLKI